MRETFLLLSEILNIEQAILCIVLMGYQIFLWGLQDNENEDNELEDPWRSTLDDIHDWISSHNAIMACTFICVMLFSYGTYLSLQTVIPSQYMCLSPLDASSSIFNVQLIGVALDGAIIMLFWNIMLGVKGMWSRTYLLGQILCLSSLATMLFGIMRAILGRAGSLTGGFESLSFVTVAFHGLVFALFAISTALWMCDTSPVDTVCVTTFIFGITKASANVFQLGNWLYLSKGQAWGPLSLVICSSVLFVRLHNVKVVVGLSRTLFMSLALLLLLVATIFATVKQTPLYADRHPISNLIYNARIEHDRWLIKATTSTTLKTAAQTYVDTHEGRLPPPKFDKWYKFAKSSPIIDEFTQIDRDLEPFWHISPSDLRRRVDKICSYPDMVYVKIKGGKVRWNEDFKHGPLHNLQSRLTKMIGKFAKDLPDMTVPINFGASPKIIPDWYTRATHSKAYSSVASGMLSSRDWHSAIEARGQSPMPRGLSNTPTKALKRINSGKFRQLQRDACPAQSAVHSFLASNFGEFCWSCAREHSEEHFAAGDSVWRQSLNTCDQPDLRYLHGFYMSNPTEPLITELLPLFSAAKTQEFSDILIPLPSDADMDSSDSKKLFQSRANNIFWRAGVRERAAVSDDAVRGNHRYRLLHMASKADPSDETTMLFRTLEDANDNKMKYVFEKLPTELASNLSRFDISFGTYTACDDDNCNFVQRLYGTLNGTAARVRVSRYVLLPDEDFGPSPATLKTLRGRSLPFLSTVFRTWYTDRLHPWLHYVPIDPRLHALHSTAAYFTGTKQIQQVNGRELVMEANVGDGEYLANQGARWARKALRERDMEIYLFRLLLEWGRLISDDRDSIGYGADAKKNV